MPCTTDIRLIMPVGDQVSALRQGIFRNFTMSLDHYLGFLLFAFVSAVTPGPNNLMLMASGANYGVRRTLPHMLGITFGFSLLIVLTGLGLARLLETFPLLERVLGVIAFAFILHLAWRIANAAPPVIASQGESRTESVGRPMTFFEALAFQWINPKAWAMGLAALATYVPSKDLAGIAIVAATYGGLVIPLALVWTAAGSRTGRLLQGPRRVLFNRVMALLLVASLVPVLLG